MRIRSLSGLIVGGFSVAILGNASIANGQETVPLDPIVVESPSPIISQGPSAGTSDEEAPAVGSPVPPGALFVIDDAFVPVTVATEREALATDGGNIGDVLDKKPGIIGSTFAPGANRPIIRGLDNYRVRVQENGIGSHDVSPLSEDHVVPIDPFSAEQIEVIRGPATLRYGSTAIGGVVAVENDRIPTSVPKGGFSAELKGGLNSVNDGTDGAAKITAGGTGFAVHADAFHRDTEDYDTPDGDQFNTFVNSKGYAFGGSLIGQDGFVGVSFSRFESLYGIPGEEAEELMPRLDVEQDRIQAKGEWRPDMSGVEAVRFWFGHSDYEHSEIVDEGHGDEVGSLFKTEVYEFRGELQHSPLATSFGRLSGAVGVQYLNSDTSGESFEGDSLLEPAETDSIAAFIFEELEVTRELTLQAASRIENTEIDGSGRVSPLDPNSPLTAMTKEFTPYSGSLGMLYHLPGDHVFSLSGQYVERAPADAELFSGGIHEATGTFEIGNPNLTKEKAATIEAGLRKKTGPFRYDTTAYYTEFDGFIFKDLTGVECNEDLDSCGNPAPGEETLDQVLFGQRDATFYGVELAMQLDVSPLGNGVWGIDGQYDFVRAKFDQGGNVPRIPPHRLGGGIFYRDQQLFARAGVLHAFDQDEISENEIETPGYTLVSAEVSYTVSDLDENGLGPQFTFGVKGENLADEKVLNHTSFKRREDVLLPGASVRVFGSVKLN